MLTADPPDHTRLRKLDASAAAPEWREGLLPRRVKSLPVRFG
ncbi:MULTISPECIES: hypothetical protein [unclassified Streptomyces]|nr:MULTISPECIES: hypothetical protein [unclassified Streptomyces]WSA91572.1 cytochrome P450 [Streptomyces sp. NBC_01795]WSB75942.1 cytochrome P450 [Streptomyces sp. NBC_01775]WSS15782.1 cytochrome P450 [Streptomyces sp. NBC_01186]WSS44621.1 cytochrome P450 [Streptomyces sp. NBC_01187]